MISLPLVTARFVEVLATADVGPRVRRITLGGSGLGDLEALPGQDFVVRLQDEQGGGIRRRYTIRHLDRPGMTFDLEVVVHGHGPGSQWGSTVKPGDQVEIFGPRGKVLLSGAGRQLFFGDESALPAIAELAEALPSRVVGAAMIEVEDAADEQPINASGIEVQWLHRNGSPAGRVDLLMNGLRSIDHMNADLHSYVFGESRVVRALREELTGRGLSADQISAKGYWNLGRGSKE
jgi:NADPH-dependent ferric siderophore reductase